MTVQALAFLAVLSFNGLVASEISAGQKCNAATNELKSWSLSLFRYRNETEEWVNFSAVKDWGDSMKNFHVNVKETLFECEGKKMLMLQGSLKDPFSDAAFTDKLKFHHITGPNTALTNKGYTVVKLKVDDSGVVLTHRPLKTNELLEVKMEKRGTAKGYANGIGVTTRSPFDGQLPTHMNTLKAGTWMLYGTNVWRNSVEILSTYTKKNIYNLSPGDRIGVMKTDTGALHFFVNGEDQGPADSNIPEIVYGVYELYGDATQATIMHPS